MGKRRRTMEVAGGGVEGTQAQICGSNGRLDNRHGRHQNKKKKKKKTYAKDSGGIEECEKLKIKMKENSGREKGETKKKNPGTRGNGGNEEGEKTTKPTKNDSASRDKREKTKKEGAFLLGEPTFLDLGNGRLRCVETGHELLAEDQEAYGRTKACRLSLIDAAVARKKPPLNMFKPHPNSKSQLVCELTGDAVNKTEEHIWKHVNGKKFLNKLEQKEIEQHANAEAVEKGKLQLKKQLKSSLVGCGKDQKKSANEKHALTKRIKTDRGDVKEVDWVAHGSRRDPDDGQDCCDSHTNSADERDHAVAVRFQMHESCMIKHPKNELQKGELAKRSKRKSPSVGPNSFSLRKKKMKNNKSVPNGS